MQKKGIRVEVFRGANGHDCTNNGLSSLVDEVILVGDMIEGVDEVKEGQAYLEVGSITFRGKTTYHAKPVNFGLKGVPFMFGGNFVWTSDSRFREHFNEPLAIHDRQEV